VYDSRETRMYDIKLYIFSLYYSIKIYDSNFVPWSRHSLVATRSNDLMSALRHSRDVSSIELGASRRPFVALGSPTQIILVIVPAPPVITDFNPSKARGPVFIARLDPHCLLLRNHILKFVRYFSRRLFPPSPPTPLLSYAWFHRGLVTPIFPEHQITCRSQ